MSRLTHHHPSTTASTTLGSWAPATLNLLTNSWHDVANPVRNARRYAVKPGARPGPPASRRRAFDSTLAGQLFSLRRMPRTSCVLLCFAVASACGVAAPRAPYPASPVIARVEFDFKTHQRHAPGSDNWPATWADDGHLYAAWGDGGGFGGSNGRGRVLLGVARIEGDGITYTGKNLWGGHQPAAPATFGGKSYGILSVKGVLYLWVAPQPNPHLATAQLAVSRDHGLTWTLADWKFAFAEGVTIPTFLNFGRDYAGARDGYVYSYLIQPAWGPGPARKTTEHTFDVHAPGHVHLSRVPQDAILDRTRYEFFAGLINGQPTWTTDLARKQPVFSDPNGVGWNLSVTYNAGLKRHLLTTEHNETHAGKLGLFDAPEPWGPWTTVAYEENWGAGVIEVTTFYWVLPSKWLSADGTQFTMIFTGKNSNDSFNTVGGRFLRRAP